MLFFPSASRAADFAATGTGAIPDNNPAGVTASFTVSDVQHALTHVRIALDLTHAYAGDLEATLTSPGGKAHLLLFGRSGLSRSFSSGYSGNLGGVYLFDDGATIDWWSSLAPLATTSALAGGMYRTTTGGTFLSYHGGCSTSLAGAFNGLAGADVNGTWTLKVADRAGGDLGSLNAATLTLLDDQVYADAFDLGLRGSCKLAQFDYTGTGRSSYLTVRNTGGGAGGATTWFIQSNDGTLAGAQQQFVFGVQGDYFLSGDFDGDGIADAVVYEPGAEDVAGFRVRRSSRPGDTPLFVLLGKNGDDPLQVGDYDGDGLDDAAVFRDGTNVADPSFTLLRYTRSGYPRTLTTGEKYSFAAAGVDYTGDGIADVAIQANAGGGEAYFRIYNGVTGAIASTFNFGTPVDVIDIGNRSGDARYDINAVRGISGVLNWFSRESGTGNVLPAVQWGASATDFVLTGDYDGDGYDDEAIWRPNADPAQVIFYVRPSATPASPITLNFGLNGDYPVANSRRH